MADGAKISENFLSLLGNLERKNDSSQRISDHDSHKKIPKKTHENYKTEDNSRELLHRRQRHFEESSTNKGGTRKDRRDKNQFKKEENFKKSAISGAFLSSLDEFQNFNLGNVSRNPGQFNQEKGRQENENEMGCIESNRQIPAKRSENSVRRRENKNLRRDDWQKNKISYHRGDRENRVEDKESKSSGSLNEDSANSFISKKSEGKKTRIMGYKFLESLLDREDSEVITTLASPKSGFQELLNDRPIRPDLLILIVKILNLVNHSEIEQLKMYVLSETLKPEFFDEIKRFCAVSCVEENSQRLRTIDSFFESILSLFQTVINIFPSMVNEKFKSVLIALNLFMKTAKDTFGIKVKDCLFEQWNSITTITNSYLEDRKRIKKDLDSTRANLMKTPNNFRNIPLVPTKDDFLTGNAFLRQNITKGSFVDVEHYLDIQFRLLREDFISPLREGIYDYVSSLTIPNPPKKYNSVKIYQKVQFTQSFKFRDIYGFLVKFDCDRKFSRTNWEYNKRFMVGSLLLFTDDCFQTFYLATVGNRDVKNHLEQGLVFVAFIPGTEIPSSIFEPDKFFTMAESEVYYESYRHVLAALKRMKEDNFPMKQYVVDVDTDGLPPKYLVNKSVYTVSGYSFDMLIESCWPSPQQLKLNQSQHQAFKAALTNEFVVVQGPPGTGKTFLALKIAEVLLTNAVSNGTPLLVVCYTNHALDQFLEGILKFTNKLIRIGSQSQNEALEKYNIDVVRKSQGKEYNYNRSAVFKTLMRDKYDLQERLAVVEQKIKQLNLPHGILDVSTLRSVIVPHHYNELDGCIVPWLMCSDNPELLNQELVMESQNSTDAAMDNLNKPRDMFQNISEFQEDHYIDKDDDENAQRLADMMEDDHFEKDFMTERKYISSAKYSLHIKDIEFEIEELQNQLLMFSENSQQFYFISLNIQNQMWTKQFIIEQYRKYENLSVYPKTLEMLMKVKSIWELSVSDRWLYYMIWIHLYCTQLEQIIQHLTDR